MRDEEKTRQLASHMRMLARHSAVLYGISSIQQDFDGNAKYWSFYIPDAADLLANIAALFNSNEVERCVLSPEGDTVYAEVGSPTTPPATRAPLLGQEGNCPAHPLAGGKLAEITIHDSRLTSFQL